jgi:predicted CxxxxCH...CXXCH cytochrome family protein
VCGDLADNDCDGLTDGADQGCAPCTDNDGDGYGSNGDITCANGTEIDCNDADGTINPGASDVNCNGIDEDCVDGPDSGYVTSPTNCGIGECAASGQWECQSGVEVNTCVQLPAGAEGPYLDATCSDGLDNDCDGLTDGADIANCSSLDVDDDGDSFTENQGDCDDTHNTVYPGAPLLCDGLDNNCDGYKDYLTDEDKDGDGVPWCASDCDDNDPNRYPGNQEGPRGDATCSDGIDNDCDNNVDAADSACAPPSCTTKFNLPDGPHIFDLLDPADNSVIASSCSWCHTDTLLGSGKTDQRLECQRCHADPGDTSDPLNGVLKDPSNPSAYSGAPPYGFGTALNVKMHSSTVLGTKYGNWDMDCLTCHNPHQQEQDNLHGTSYGKYIREYICFDNPSTGLNTEEIIEFTAASGAGSFADAPPHNENICEMCHTQTSYHQRTGLSLAHNDGTNCIDCHLHDKGFKPSCGTCHAVPPPTGSHLTHFGATNDDAAYGSTGTTDDYSGQANIYVMNCGNCHPIDLSQHMNGVTNSGNGTAEIELYNQNAPAGSLKALHPPTATYTPGPQLFTDADGFNYTQGTCSNVYCHSVTNVSTTGQIPEPLPWVYPLYYDPPWEDFVVRTTQYQSPVWGVDTLGCDGCHGYPITTECAPDPITGGCTEVDAGAGDSHAWIDMYGEINLHAWNMKIYFDPLQCNTCHYDTVREDALWLKDYYSVSFDDIQIYNTAAHVNGIKDVAFTAVPVEYQRQFEMVYQDLSVAVFDPVAKTCSNVSCHQAQSVVKWGAPYRWENATECNVCHSY